MPESIKPFSPRSRAEYTAGSAPEPSTSAGQIHQPSSRATLHRLQGLSPRAPTQTSSHYGSNLPSIEFDYHSFEFVSEAAKSDPNHRKIAIAIEQAAIHGALLLDPVTFKMTGKYRVYLGTKTQDGEPATIKLELRPSSDGKLALKSASLAPYGATAPVSVIRAPEETMPSEPSPHRHDPIRSTINPSLIMRPSASVSGQTHRSSALSRFVDSVTVRSADLTNPETQLQFKEFLVHLKEKDPASYKKRYGRTSVGDIYKGDAQEVHFFAYRKNKIIGCADYIRDIKGITASVNNVVFGEYQGRGIGKKLATERDAHLRAHGYRYQVGGVYPNNVAQINRLLSNGWRESSVPDENGEMRFFWKALDPKYVNTEPENV
jgi:GNAT superfamily N-acetyltransferase